MQVCKVGGKTGFQLPGSDICVVLGGFVRTQIGFTGSGTGIFDTSSSNANYAATVTGALKVGAYTNTEMGLLASNADFRITNGGAASIDSASIALGGFVAGWFDSKFSMLDGGAGLKYADSPSTKDVTVGYSAALGNGTTIGVYLEQAAPLTGAEFSIVKALAGSSDPRIQAKGDQSMPDVVGTLDFSAAGAMIHLGASWHDLSDNVDIAEDVAMPSSGYAFDAALKFGLDSIAKGDSVTIEYSYANGDAKRLVNHVGFSDVGVYDAVDGEAVTGYSFGGEYNHHFSNNLNATLYGAYASIDEAGYITDTSVIGLQFDFQPVKNFHVIPDIYHVTTSGDSWRSEDNEGSLTAAVLRIQRDF